MNVKLALITVLLVSFSLFGCLTQDNSKEETSGEDKAGNEGIGTSAPNTVEKGDYVAVDYVGKLKSGGIIDTSYREVVENETINKTEFFKEKKYYTPLVFVAGEGKMISGFDNGVLGMDLGEEKTFTVPPEEGYGKRNESLVVEKPRVNHRSRDIEVPLNLYKQNYGEPELGKAVQVDPWPINVSEIKNNTVVLRSNPDKGQVVPVDNGEYQVISLNKTNISLKFTPELNKPILDQKRRTYKTYLDYDNETITVDYNHPFAGKELSFDIKVVYLVKKDNFGKYNLTFMNSYDKALQEAGEKGEEVVLYFSSPTCSWCDRFEKETLSNPVVASFEDRAVWVKINIQENPGLKEEYGVEGTPTTVILDSSGNETVKVPSFMSPENFGGLLAGNLL